MDVDTAIRVAQGAGIIASAISGGAGLCLSVITVPGLLAGPPDVMAKQWKTIYDVGKQILPPFSIVFSSVPYAYLAWTVSELRISYAFAAILPTLAVPYTAMVMQPTYDKLIARAKARETLKPGEGATEIRLPRGESTPELIQTWAYLNYGRSLFSIIAAVFGYWIVTS